ncbi:MAG TPA: hypothetical protein VGB01_01945 [candidate division Zixibacteria bacterium]
MDQKIERIPITELSEKLIDEIIGEIKPYVISLVGLNDCPSGEEVQLLGSGTLIKIEDEYGILTAQHVIPPLRKFKKLGLNLGTFVHERPQIDTNLLQIVENGTRAADSIGPDLAVIILPEYITGMIKPKKPFWNISYNAKNVLSKIIDPEIGLCFVCGVVGEWTKISGPRGGFNKVLNCCCLCGYVGIEKYWNEEEFDYLKLSVNYENRPDLPASFGGVSGGGIWRTVLYRSEEGVISYSDLLFLGVAILQTPTENNLRSIIGHGWLSIYDLLPKLIKKNSNF